MDRDPDSLDSPPDLPITLSALRSAFGLAGSLDFVSFHAGTSGAWRIAGQANVDIAVKALPAESPDYQLEQLRVTADLERRALAAGLPIVPPVEPAEPGIGLAARTGEWLVWAHRWIESAAPVEPIAMHHWVGETTARLHALWPTLRSQEDVLAQHYGIHDQQDWQGWIDDAYRANLTWTTDVSVAMPALREASRLVRAALRHPDLARCISHRDLKPCNVISGDDGPLLGDFDSSGMEAPWLELVDAAQAFGQPDPVTIEAYRRAGGAPGPETIEALARGTGVTMNFLAFSMWLSLGHRRVREDQRAAATDRIPELAVRLSTQVESLETTRRRLFGR